MTGTFSGRNGRKPEETVGNKITILYIFAALPVGGAEQVLVTEVEGLDNNRYRPLEIGRAHV
jgi:hypothetical protein